MKPRLLVFHGCLAVTLMTGCSGKDRETGSIEIDRPPAIVFNYLVDGDLRKTWVGGIKDIKVLSGGPPGVGNKVRETMEMNGEAMAVDAEVIQYEAGKLLGVRGSSDMFDLGMVYTLEDAGGKTRLNWTADFDFKPMMMKMMAGMIGPDIKKKMDLDFVKLKALSEAKPD